ncbi:MAG TPA: hypothetical protein VGF32_26750 [Streptosporangiaceae bacterium]|jgi:hypothetical protein
MQQGPGMRGAGTNCGTGFFPGGTHPGTLRPHIVRREMRIIADEHS